MGKKPKTVTSDDALHRTMLEQLGLKADTKEGKIMMKEIKNKLGGAGLKKNTKQGSDDEGNWNQQEDEASHDDLP
jgi:hypothetical protein